MNLPSFQHDRYRLVEHLGSGGFGVVYRAYDQKLQRDVALKIFTDNNRNILHEAQALARLNSPNVVKVFDVIQEADQVAIVMELVQTSEVLSLDSLRAMPPLRFLTLYCQLLEAVEAIHEAGVLHLDIKLSNILLNTEGQVKLTDFSISRLDNQLQSPSPAQPPSTADSTSHGSWFCLAPEQLNRKAVGVATDVFALGVLLHYYLYDDHPFLCPGDIHQSQQNIGRARVRPVDRAAKITNQSLVQLTRAMLNKSAKKRPSLETVMQIVERTLQDFKGLPEATETLTLPSVKPGNSLRKIVLAAALIAPVGLGLYYVMFSTAVVTTLVVPTLQIDHDGNSVDIKHQDNNLLTSVVIEDEITAAVIQDPGRRLVSKKEWSGSRDWQQEAEQLEVEEIIFSEVSCGREFCQVRIGIYNHPENQRTHYVQKSIPHEKLTVFSQVVDHMLRSDLDLKGEKKANHNITDADLKVYSIYKDKLETYKFEKTELPELRALAARNPEFAGANLLLGVAFLEIFKATKNQQWLDKAEAWAVKMSQQFPKDPTVLEMAFKTYIKKQDIELAEQTLARLKGLAGLDLNQLSLAGSLLLFKQDQTQGYGALMKLHSPRLTHSYFHHKAYMENKLGDYRRLSETARGWLQRFPEADLARFFLANSHLHLGLLEQALDLYMNLPFLASDYASLNNLAICQLFLGHYQDSEATFKQAMALAPEVPEASLNVGEALKAQGDPRSEQYFLDALSKSQRLSSPRGVDYAYQALALAHLQRWESATIALQQAAQGEIGKTFYLVAAYVHSLMDNPQTALFNANMASEMGYRDHWFNLPWTAVLHRTILQQSTQQLSHTGSLLSESDGSTRR